MATRTLSWYVGGFLQATPHDGAERFGAGLKHVLDAHYNPVRLRLRAGGAPKFGSVVLDINDDGTSIFTGGKPQLDQNTLSKDHDVFSPLGQVRMEKDSVMSLSITSIASEAKDLTVELDMEEIE